MNLVDLYLQKQQNKKIKPIGVMQNAIITFSDGRTISAEILRLEVDNYEYNAPSRAYR